MLTQVINMATFYSNKPLSTWYFGTVLICMCKRLPEDLTLHLSQFRTRAKRKVV